MIGSGQEFKFRKLSTILNEVEVSHLSSLLDEKGAVEWFYGE